MGYVYIFNSTVERMRLSVNGVQTAPVNPPPLPSPSVQNPYRPLGIQAQRVDRPTSGAVFLNGTANEVAVQLQTRQSTTLSVPIPAPSQSTDDLWLYTTLQLLLLLSTEGKILAQTAVVWAYSNDERP